MFWMKTLFGFQKVKLGFFDEVENPYQASEEQEQIEDFTEFPVMKVTIENNEQAWSLYQMLKAHFKE